MYSKLSVEIFTLNMRYYDMRIVEDSIHRYNDRNDPEHKIRDVLSESLQSYEKLYNEQNELVEKLINNN